MVRAQKRFPSGVFLMLIAWAGIAAGAERVSVDASRRGSAVGISARATITAPHALIWQTLTDYDHLSEFIPGIATSRVIARRDNGAIVEQSGKADFLFFVYPIEVVVEAVEEPPNFIGIKLLKGNLKQLDGGYLIEKTGSGKNEFVLRWSGIIEPSASVPLFITVPLMRSSISKQFRGMVKEIERRETLRIAGGRSVHPSKK